jgi:hypothetical protein
MATAQTFVNLQTGGALVAVDKNKWGVHAAHPRLACLGTNVFSEWD